MYRAKKLRFALNYGKNRLLSRMALEEGRPWNVTANLTFSCNLRCRQCNLWKQGKTKELDTKEWKKILNDTIDWLGSCYITITGGEPLLRRDAVKEIIGLASKRGIMTNLITNGFFLDDELLRELEDSGLSTLSVSLDGREETHDRLRGKRGLYKSISLAIESADKNGIKLKTIINTTIMKPNLDELTDLVAWSKLNNTSIKFQALVQNFGERLDPAWFRRSALWPDETAKTLSVIHDIISMKSRGYPVENSMKQLMAFKQYYRSPAEACSNLVCNAGQNMNINPDGEVRICPAMGPLGGLAKHRAKTIWNSGKSRAVRRNITECRHCCKILNCNFNDGLKGRVWKLFNL
jgi:MoaA/NifB/PqqE/SkfB family radical SAM enzyme